MIPARSTSLQRTNSPIRKRPGVGSGAVSWLVVTASMAEVTLSGRGERRGGEGDRRSPLQPPAKRRLLGRFPLLALAPARVLPLLLRVQGEPDRDQQADQ